MIGFLYNKLPSKGKPWRSPQGKWKPGPSSDISQEGGKDSGRPREPGVGRGGPGTSARDRSLGALKHPGGRARPAPLGHRRRGHLCQARSRRPRLRLLPPTSVSPETGARPRIGGLGTSGVALNSVFQLQLSPQAGPFCEAWRTCNPWENIALQFSDVSGRGQGLERILPTPESGVGGRGVGARQETGG